MAIDWICPACDNKILSGRAHSAIDCLGVVRGQRDVALLSKGDEMEDPYYIPPCGCGAEKKLRAAILQIHDLAVAWADRKGAVAANVPSGDFAEDEARWGRVGVTQRNLEALLNKLVPVVQKPKSEEELRVCNPCGRVFRGSPGSHNCAEKRVEGS